MSKKLYATEKWKKHLKRRQDYEQKKAERENKGRRGRYFARPERIAKQKRHFLPLRAPNVFSMVRNPTEMVQFLNTLRLYADKNNVQLDLSQVTLMTTDGIAALTSTISGLDADVTGNQPDDEAAKEILAQSGFFKYVRSREPVPPPKKGHIGREHSKKVEPRIARDLIRVGTTAIHGAAQRCQSAYRILIECMNNTHNHAARVKYIEKETWWATVYADVEQKRVCYTFIDTGVGIFRSVRIGVVRRAYKLIGIQNDVTILRDILHGRIKSSTGLPHRGKGLPAINREWENGRIESLVIVANGVYANVGQGVYKLLGTEFHGTLLYWEVQY